MSSITNIASGDLITDSRAVLNDNFSALNSDKEEVSNKSTDTTMAANSDTLYPSQAAVKAYVDALGGQTFLVPTGAILPYGASSAPANYLLCDGSEVSRSTYSTLFGVISTTYGTGDGSTTFTLPDLRSSFPLGSGQKTKAFTFLDADVNTSTDVITIDSNKYLYTGQAVVASTTGTLPSGLSATTYYVIYVSDTTIKLATTVANANAGTAVDITAAAGGGTHTLTFSLTSRSLADEGGEETHALTDSEMPSHTHTLPMDNGGSGSSITPGIESTTASRSTGSAGSDSPHNNMPPFVTVNYIIKT